ncbi:MAG: hypothetical protein OXF48_03660 [Bacteroidetes bacterium]|nr:hypothetical protein [Bacteroidota bacterium]
MRIITPKTIVFSFLILFVLPPLGVSLSFGQEVASDPASPVVGSWDYIVDSSDGVFTGKIMVVETETGLDATIMADVGEEVDVVQTEKVEFDTETQTFSFSIPQSDYGEIEGSLVLSEEGMSGTLYLVQSDISAPITATPTEE